jgi:riboflavin kinase / FMN adenylyltransferase
VVHGRKLGRSLGASTPAGDDGFRTLNLRFSHPKPAALGIYAVRVHGLTDNPGAQPLDGVASLGKRPTVDDSGRVLLETYVLDWPEALGADGGYGKLVRVELLHKLRDEARYDGLQALTAAIGKDVVNARTWLASHTSAHAAESRQTSRDRII